MSWIFLIVFIILIKFINKKNCNSSILKLFEFQSWKILTNLDYKDKKKAWKSILNEIKICSILNEIKYKKNLIKSIIFQINYVKLKFDCIKRYVPTY